MDVIQTVKQMRQLGSSWRKGGKAVALVPTMGALHAGHMKLIERARSIAPFVVVSSFVNPLQFDNPEDLKKYPRPADADRAACEKAGVTHLFTPTAEDMFPAGFLTTANVSFLSEKLEGKSRPGHFRGVCTVVLKLLNIIQPTHAMFGIKDAQQCIVITHMVRDLAIDTEIVPVATVRDKDGLALSSRNARLTAEQRGYALCLNRALKRVHFLVKKQGIVHCGELMQAIRSAINSQQGVQMDYAAIVSRTTLEPLDNVEAGNTLVALAVKVGDVRLIDNTRL